MAKYRKTALVDAIRWDGTNLESVIEFTNGRRPATRDSHASMRWDDYESLVAREGLKIYTLEGVLTAAKGDWILKGGKGECWPVRADIFTDTYEAVVE